MFGYKRKKLEYFECKGLAPYILCRYLEKEYTRPRPNVKTRGHISLRDIFDISIVGLYDILAEKAYSNFLIVPLFLCLISVKYCFMRVFGWLFALKSVCFTCHELEPYRGRKLILAPGRYRSDSPGKRMMDDVQKLNQDYYIYHNDLSRPGNNK